MTVGSETCILLKLIDICFVLADTVSCTRPETIHSVFCTPISNMKDASGIRELIMWTIVSFRANLSVSFQDVDLKYVLKLKGKHSLSNHTDGGGWFYLNQSSFYCRNNLYSPIFILLLQQRIKGVFSFKSCSLKLNLTHDGLDTRMQETSLLSCDRGERHLAVPDSRHYAGLFQWL